MPTPNDRIAFTTPSLMIVLPSSVGDLRLALARYVISVVTHFDLIIHSVAAVSGARPRLDVWLIALSGRPRHDKSMSSFLFLTHCYTGNFSSPHLYFLLDFVGQRLIFVIHRPSSHNVVYSPADHLTILLATILLL